MERLNAIHEVPAVINVVSGTNLQVKLHQAIFVVFLMATNFLCLVTIF